MSEHNEKYVVFKREDWEADPVAADRLRPFEVADAVVIRRQDVFASTSLDAYANNIATAVETIKHVAGPDLDDILGKKCEKMSSVADYFHEQAELSAHATKKLPD